MNIRNQLIRSCATIGLIIVSAAAVSATAASRQSPQGTMPDEVRAMTDRASASEPLSVVWLPTVAVRAQAEPLGETWLPTIYVTARAEHLAMEAAPVAPYARAIAATLPIGVAK